MNIFYKRPLCLILCVMLGGLFLFSHGSFEIRCAVITIAVLLALVFGILTLVSRRKFILPKLLSVFLLLSLIFSYLYFNQFEIAQKYGDDEVEIVGCISDIDSSSAYTTNLTVTDYSIARDDRTDGGKIILRISKEDAMYAHIGAYVKFNAVLKPVESNGNFDSKAYYYSDGISAFADDYSSFEVFAATDDGGTLESKLTLLSENISRHSMLVMGSEAGSLFAAVFMGDKTYLSSRLSLDFMRTGISHILALSGMHLAILSLAITRLLSLLGVGKRARTPIIMLFIIFYMALTGFSVSVCRAGIMLIISSLLYLLASVKDMPTNLALSVFIICTLTPYAIFDVSLWLSAFATLGIISIGDIFSKKLQNKNIFLRFLGFIGSSFTASFFAISTTLAISTSFARSTSLLAALATLIFSLLIEIFIYLGLIMLGITMLFPIGEAVMKPLYTLIDNTANAMSSQRWVLVSTDEKHIKILIGVFTLLFFAFLILKIKYIKTALIFLVCSFIAVHGVAAYVTFGDVYSDEIIYTSSENHDIMLMKSGGESVLLDICTYSESSSYDTVDFLKDNNIFSLDMYVASHYSFGLDDAVDTLLSQIKTKAVLLPRPVNEDEEEIFTLVNNMTDLYDTALITYQIGETVSLGDIEFSEMYRVNYGEGTAKCAFEVSYSKTKTAYLGSGMLEYLTRDLSYSLIKLSDTVIFGSHGSKYIPSYRFSMAFDKPKRFIISGENIYISTDAEQYYKEKSTEILTDPGTVRIFS